MRHLIQFPSGQYFFGGKTINLFASAYSTENLLEATAYDDIKDANALRERSPKGTKIISISTKDLFKLKLKGVFLDSGERIMSTRPRK